MDQNGSKHRFLLRKGNRFNRYCFDSVPDLFQRFQCQRFMDPQRSTEPRGTETMDAMVTAEIH